MHKKVIVTGTLGQDGANMCDFLLKKGNIKVFGMIRRSANPNYINCEAFINHPNFQFVYGDLIDLVSINKLVQDIQPDYFINFAANSFVGCSWDMPMQVFDTNAIGVMRCLESIRKFKPNCRFYSAGSSEEFGNVDYSPQDIHHPIKPRSPYGASKASARHIVKVYRESYGMFAIHGILFNHEGIKRGEEFVTRKISKGVAEICHAISRKKPFVPIELGNLDSKRDWSDSEDFVAGIWAMLNQEEYNQKLKKDYQDALYSIVLNGSKEEHEQWETKWLSSRAREYVLSSGETHSIREFVEKAFLAAGIEGFWRHEGTDEKYFLTNYVREEHPDLQGTLVKINPKFYRPAEVDLLLGDSSPIREDLNWAPRTSFDQLVEKMVKYDISLLEKT